MIDRKLGWVCLQWSNVDEVDSIIQNKPSKSDKWGVEVVKRCELVSIESVTDFVYVISSNFRIENFNQELPWSHHRFNINGF